MQALGWGLCTRCCWSCNHPRCGAYTRPSSGLSWRPALCPASQGQRGDQCGGDQGHCPPQLRGGAGQSTPHGLGLRCVWFARFFFSTYQFFCYFLLTQTFVHENGFHPLFLNVIDGTTIQVQVQIMGDHIQTCLGQTGCCYETKKFHEKVFNDL